MAEMNDEIHNSSISTLRAKDTKVIVNGKEYYGLNITNVIVAHPSTQDNVPKSERKSYVAQEVFNKKVQKHDNWVLVDLETGGRGYYPGCKLFGKTISSPTNLYMSRNDTSPILIQLFTPDTEVEILERFPQNDENPFWYYCQYSGMTGTLKGYIRRTELMDLEYR